MIQSRQVEAFRAVMMSGAMTAAARIMNVTQPAISRLVRDLERETGLVLFYRRGNIIEPTAQARVLYDEIERFFVGLQQIANVADDLRRGQRASLRVGALPTMAGFLPRFVATFALEYPLVQIFVDSRPSPQIRDDVVSGRLDIGVTALPFAEQRLLSVPLNDMAVVALPAGHRLARCDVVKASDLHGEDIILLSKFTKEHRHAISFALQDAALGRVTETPLASIACTLVSAGLGLAIVDPFSASDCAGQGLVFRRFVPAAQLGVAVIHSADRPLSSVARAFRATFLAHVEDFLGAERFLRADVAIAEHQGSIPEG